jgi:hypothetical protein
LISIMAEDWSAYPVTRTLLPHQDGAKKLKAQYGPRLVCVRYRNDITQGRKITTVEIVVAERPWTPVRPSISPDTILPITVEYHETDLRHAVKAAGGIWDRQHKVWRVAYRDIVALGLIERLVTEHVGEPANE